MVEVTRFAGAPKVDLDTQAVLLDALRWLDEEKVAEPAPPSEPSGAVPGEPLGIGCLPVDDPPVTPLPFGLSSQCNVKKGTRGMKIVTLFMAMELLGRSATVYAQSGHPPGVLPAAAYSACSGKSQGDACTVRMGERAIAGSCENPPPDATNKSLACRPAGPPPR